MSVKVSVTLEAMIHEFIDCLRNTFAQELGLDPRGFKKQVLRLVQRELPPRRGTPGSPQIEAALAMLRQGKTVHEVLRIGLPAVDLISLDDGPFNAWWHTSLDTVGKCRRKPQDRGPSPTCLPRQY